MVDTSEPRRLDVFIAAIRKALDEFEAAPVLADLSITDNIGRVGTAASFQINDVLDGSTISLVPPDGLTLQQTLRRMVGTPETAGIFSIVVRETNAIARNSPHDSTIKIEIKPRLAAATRVTLGNQSIRLGNSTVRLSGLIPPDDRPRLTLTGPSSFAEGDPSNDRPLLTLTGPASFAEGNPATDRPLLNLTGPSSFNEGN